MFLFQNTQIHIDSLNKHCRIKCMQAKAGSCTMWQFWSKPWGRVASIRFPYYCGNIPDTVHSCRLSGYSGGRMLPTHTQPLYCCRAEQYSIWRGLIRPPWDLAVGPWALCVCSVAPWVSWGLEPTSVQKQHLCEAAGKLWWPLRLMLIRLNVC